MRRLNRGLTGALAVAALAATLPDAAHAQAVPDSEVGFSAFFNRDYANQFPGPEQGEAEITHMDMTFTDVFGVRVNVMHDNNIRLNDPGMTAPWRVTVRRAGQVIAETVTRTDPRSRPPLQQADILLYPQAGDVVSAVGPAGYRPRSITFDGLPALDRCALRSGAIAGRISPGAPSLPRMLPDRIEHGHTQLPLSGSGSVTIPVPGGPTTSIAAQTSRQVAPLDYVISRVRADPPFCGGLGPRDGYIDGGELNIARRGVQFFDPVRCSPYSAVRCRVLIKASARRRGKRVAAIKSTTWSIAPGETTAGRRVRYKRWVRRALKSERRKDPVVTAKAYVKHPAFGSREMVGSGCSMKPGAAQC
jgi:hypothetical protein